MMRNKKINFLFLFIILCILAGIFFLRKANNKNEIFYREVYPFFGDIRKTISTTGTIEPQNRVEIKPPIGGRIEEILVREGDKVKKGQILSLMSSTERAALLDAAHLKGEEELKYWQEVYKPTPLIAPIDGEVIVRAVEPGQTVTANDTVLVLSDRLIVKAHVDETDIGNIKMGQKAIITLDAYPDIKVKAKVNHISYESEIVNNVTIYEVDILPVQTLEVFRSGMSANIDIVTEEKKNVLLIPVGAVIGEKGTEFVLVKIHKKEMLKKKITTGLSDDKNVEILEGLSSQNTVLIKSKKYILPTKKETSLFMPNFRKKK